MFFTSFSCIGECTLLADILKDILELKFDKNLKIKDKYYFDCSNGVVNFKEFEKVSNIRGVIANLYEIDSFEFIKSYTKTISTIDTTNNKFTCLVYADNRLHKGVIIPLDNNKIGMNEDFLVTKSDHTIEGTIETVKIELAF